jgi:hypothetical protein
MTMNVKTDQMIALVLQINGFVKADDLHTLPPDERAVALRSYYQDHSGNSELHWRGEQLWSGTAGPDTSFFAETPADTAPAPSAVGAVADAGSSYGQQYAVPAPSGVDVYGDLTPAAQPATVGVATLGPALSTSSFGEGTAASAAVSPSPLSSEPIFAEPDVYTPPVDSHLETDFLPDPVTPPAVVMPDESRVSPWWWVLAILWAPLGGLVGYLVMKGTNPSGAAKVLKVSLLVWGVSILVGVILGVLPFLLG